MKILYDLHATQPIGNTKFHGGGEYCKEIFINILKRDLSNIIIEAFADLENELDSGLIEVCREHKIKLIDCKNNKEINKLLQTNNYDVFYSGLPYEYDDLMIPSKTKFIMTIHGLRGMELPFNEVYCEYTTTKLKKYIKKMYYKIFSNKKNADYHELEDKIKKICKITSNRVIITDSYHSKYAINYFFPEINPNDIKVYYAPVKVAKYQDDSSETSILNKYNLSPQKYILLVSGNRWEKNVFGGVIALDKLFSKKFTCLSDIRILVLGVANENMYKRNILNQDKFIFSGYVKEEELEAIYKNAHLFLYPTLNEGFGYPPLEAMRYGTLSACSAVTSVSEVCGDGVLYFNPYDQSEIANRILQSFDPQINSNLKIKLKQRYSEIVYRQQIDIEKIVDEIIC